MLYLVLFLLTKSQNINETPIKTISLEYFGLFKFEKIAVCENKYTRNNRSPMREIKSSRKSVRIR